MLTTYPNPGNAGQLPAAAAAISWIDLLQPTGEEVASVESRYGLELASREELSAVELSSRLSERDGVLYLSMPTISYLAGLEHAPSPVGFVLSKDLLVTIRFTKLRSFDTVAQQCSGSKAHLSSAEIFASITGEVSEVNADLMEEIAAELDGVSRAIFSTPGDDPHVTQSNDELRRVLARVGKAGEQLSRIRDGLLGLRRIVPFVADSGHPWISAKVRGHLKTILGDLSSLAEYEDHLSDKVQFLLDAVLGFINTKQNDIFQVLTVISVVGIPPTLVASIYGMNFRNMPELAWTWGYEYALVLIVLSAILPILWFKWKKWV